MDILCVIVECLDALSISLAVTRTGFFEDFSEFNQLLAQAGFRFAI